MSIRRFYLEPALWITQGSFPWYQVHQQPLFCPELRRRTSVKNAGWLHGRAMT